MAVALVCLFLANATGCKPTAGRKEAGLDAEAPASLRANKAPSGHLRLGVLSVRFADGRLDVETPGGHRHFANDATDFRYAFILRTARPNLAGCDGVVEANADVQAIPADRPLTVDDMTLFPFFSRRPTTIGFLLGSAGASGGSTQNMILLDTESGAVADVKLTDMHAPLWIDDRIPPSYAETSAVLALGSHALSSGCAPRVCAAFSFNGSQYERDSGLESRLYLEHFEKSVLSEQHMQELRKENLGQIDRDAGERFLDYVYYGTRSGATNAVRALLQRVSPAVRNATLDVLLWNVK